MYRKGSNSLYRDLAARLIAFMAVALATATLSLPHGTALAGELTLEMSDPGALATAEAKQDAASATETEKEAEVEALLRQGVRQHSEYVDVSSVGADQDAVQAAWTSLVNDPAIYTLYAQSSYTLESDKVVGVTLIYAVPASQLDDYESKVEAKVTEALAWTSPTMDDAHKAQALHDYLVRTCSYDSTAASNPDSDHAAYTAVGALVNGRAVCQGYSDAYSLLLSRAGIESAYVSSSAMNHGWNMVRIGKAWYNVDVTWDDPLADGQDQGFDATVSHDNFLKGDATFRSLGHHDWTAGERTASGDYQMTYGTYKGRYVEPATTNPTPQKPSKVASRAMYRLYNPNSGEHFYTADTKERDSVVRAGWRYEGIGWRAPQQSSSPVYRLYNPNAGDHHYTLSVQERDHLVSVGWRYEGIGWYSDDNREVPLYRQYNPNARAGAHNFTASRAENDHLVSLGWRAEGIGWYGTRG